MARYEVTRSEIRTRRWIVDADSEEEALIAYADAEPVSDDGDFACVDADGPL